METTKHYVTAQYSKGAIKNRVVRFSVVSDNTYDLILLAQNKLYARLTDKVEDKLAMYRDGERLTITRLEIKQA